MNASLAWNRKFKSKNCYNFILLFYSNLDAKTMQVLN